MDVTSSPFPKGVDSSSGTSPAPKQPATQKPEVSRPLPLIFKKIQKQNQRQEKNANEILTLKERISGYEKSIASANQKMEKLTSDIEKATTPILEGSEPRKQMEIEKEQVQKYTQNLSAQTKLLQNKTEEAEKMLSNKLTLVKYFFEQFESQFTDLNEKIKDGSGVTTEDLQLLFAIESEVRTLLETEDFPNKGKYQKIHGEQVVPALNQAKELMKKNPMQSAVKGAAGKGRALQAGLEVLDTRRKSASLVKNAGVSNQEVFLFPKEGGVLKHLSEVNKNEEEIVDTLMQIFMPESTVPSINIHHVSAANYGMGLSQAQIAKSYKVVDLSLEELVSYSKHLSKNDAAMLSKYVIDSTSSVDAAKVNFEERGKETWHVKLSETSEWQEMSLKDLRALYTQDKIAETALIGQSQDQAEPLLTQMGENTSFFRALVYTPSSASEKDYYLAPDLTNPTQQVAFEACEKFTWSYKDLKGKEHTGADFKTVHSQFLQGNLSDISNPEPLPGNEGLSKPSIEDAFTAIEAKLKLINPNLMKMTGAGKPTQLADVQAKPFVKDMTLFKDLDSTSTDDYLKRMSPKGEVQAILTGLMQCLDLHSGNIGVRVATAPEHEKFKTMNFVYQGSTLTFSDLFQKNMKQSLDPNVEIFYEEEGVEIRKPLKDLPELSKALEAPTELVIFDMDISMSESNKLQEQVRKGVSEHLIPIRSALFSSQWKDKPLSKEALQKIKEDIVGNASAAESWITRADAPIYKRLSNETGLLIKQEMAPLIATLNLREHRKAGEKVSAEELGRSAGKELSDITNTDYLPLWETIEDDLSSVTVLPKDTFETLAKRHNQTVGELRQLNPDKELVPGEKIKIDYDITSLSPDAQRRRLSISMQLFPRISAKQHEALNARMSAMKNYIANVETLIEADKEGNLQIEQLESFVKDPSSPLTSVERVDFLQQIEIEKELGEMSDIGDLYDQILAKSDISYFNIMKAMYPLLSDAHALNQQLLPNEDVGQFVGLYSTPLEDSIKAGVKSTNREIRTLAGNLKTAIASTPEPAFFGNWG